MADLIMFAGNVAIESVGGLPMTFCAGRTDAELAEEVAPVLENFEGSLTPKGIRADMERFGFTLEEYIAMIGGGHSIGQMHPTRSGFFGTWTFNPTKLDNEYFVQLLKQTWEHYEVPETGKHQYRAKDAALYLITPDR